MSICTAITAFALMIIMSCHLEENVAGGSEIGNPTVVGDVFYPANGTVAENVLVLLRPADYLKDPVSQKQAPASILNTMTDSNGTFVFDSVEPGAYRIEMRDENSNAWLIEVDIVLGTDTVYLDQAGLVPTGGVEGHIVLEHTNVEPQIYVQVFGLDHVAAVEMATGAFAIQDLPIGQHVFHFYSLESEILPDSIEVSIVPNATTTVEGVLLQQYYSHWTQMKKIHIAPENAGITLTENVINFPLLVRLEEAVFDFTSSNGEDIRFSNAKGKPLPYQIERWDDALKVAEIWVQIDTLFAGSDPQFIHMHWGNNGALDKSHGPDVFSSRAGFAAVWHLTEEKSGINFSDLLYQSSSESRNSGSDNLISEVQSGQVGLGHHFTKGDYIEVPDASTELSSDSLLSISAWFRVENLDASGAVILTMGDNYGLRFGNGPSDANKIITFWVYSNEPGVGFHDQQISALPYLDSSWHYVHVNYRSGNQVQIYMDGAIVLDVATPVKINYDWWNNILIGKHVASRPYYYFEGDYDEVRVSSITRSAQWVRLEYENQKSGSSLTSFE